MQKNREQQKMKQKKIYRKRGIEVKVAVILKCFKLCVH